MGRGAKRTGEVRRLCLMGKREAALTPKFFGALVLRTPFFRPPLFWASLSPETVLS